MFTNAFEYLVWDANPGSSIFLLSTWCATDHLYTSSPLPTSPWSRINLVSNPWPASCCLFWSQHVVRSRRDPGVVAADADGAAALLHPHDDDRRVLHPQSRRRHEGSGEERFRHREFIGEPSALGGTTVPGYKARPSLSEPNVFLSKSNNLAYHPGPVSPPGGDGSSIAAKLNPALTEPFSTHFSKKIVSKASFFTLNIGVRYNLFKPILFLSWSRIPKENPFLRIKIWSFPLFRPKLFISRKFTNLWNSWPFVGSGES